MSAEVVLSALPSPLLTEAKMHRDRAMSHYQARSLFGGSHRLHGRRNGLGFDGQKLWKKGAYVFSQTISPRCYINKSSDFTRCCHLRLEQKWIEISVDTFQMFHMLFRVTLIRQDLHLTTPSCSAISNEFVYSWPAYKLHKDGRGHGTLAGADVKIRLEPFKGCKRRVRNIKGTSVFVELKARMKVLSQAMTDQSITSGLIDINFTAEMMDPALPPNPKKAVLYRPSVPLLTSVVATICEELPPESVVLLYISASGHFYLTNCLLHKMKETAKSTGIQDRVVNLSSVAHGCPYFTRSITRAGILRSYVAGLYKNVVTPVSELMQRSFSSRLRSLGLWTSLLTPFTGLDKISSLALTDKEILGEGDNTKLEIQIKLDKEKKILSIRDRGVGMIKDLRTIAKSETL
ncbi:hypothetical protein T459_05043 [Capsicum annuum]|uniref:Uncharacterized protein n=1 Tax=Capsicum annuum TaxID=4072 RepID=A0A2G3A6X4_CAPAN|nr:hypothetical protein T459_05043 [Capsicum annuum]